MANIRYIITAEGNLKAVETTAKSINQNMAQASSHAQKYAQSVSRGGTFGAGGMSGGGGGGRSGLGRGTSGATLGSGDTRDFARQAQGLGGLVHLYATFAANVFAVSTAFNALSKAKDVSNMFATMSIVTAKTGENIRSLSRDVQQLTNYSVSLENSVKFSNMATSAGQTSAQLKELAAGAQAVSVIMGRDVNDALDRLVRGTAKLEPELLDELGILTRASEAYRNYAKEIGTTEDKLTSLQKSQAYTNAVIAELQSKYGGIDTIKGMENGYKRFMATFQETMQTILDGINTVVEPMFLQLGKVPEAMGAGIVALTAMLANKALPLLEEFQRKKIDSLRRIEQEDSRSVEESVQASMAKQYALKKSLSEKIVNLEREVEEKTTNIVAESQKQRYDLVKKGAQEVAAVYKSSAKYVEQLASANSFSDIEVNKQSIVDSIKKSIMQTDTQIAKLGKDGAAIDEQRKDSLNARRMHLVNLQTLLESEVKATKTLVAEQSRLNDLKGRQAVVEAAITAEINSQTSATSKKTVAKRVGIEASSNMAAAFGDITKYGGFSNVIKTLNAEYGKMVTASMAASTGNKFLAASLANVSAISRVAGSAVVGLSSALLGILSHPVFIVGTLLWATFGDTIKDTLLGSREALNAYLDGIKQLKDSTEAIDLSITSYNKLQDRLKGVKDAEAARAMQLDSLVNITNSVNSALQTRIALEEKLENSKKERDTKSALGKAWHDFMGEDAENTAAIAEADRMFMAGIRAQAAGIKDLVLSRKAQALITEAIIAANSRDVLAMTEVQNKMAQLTQTEKERNDGARNGGREVAKAWEELLSSKYMTGVEAVAAFAEVKLKGVRELGESAASALQTVAVGGEANMQLMITQGQGAVAQLMTLGNTAKLSAGDMTILVDAWVALGAVQAAVSSGASEDTIKRLAAEALPKFAAIGTAVESINKAFGETNSTTKTLQKEIKAINDEIKLLDLGVKRLNDSIKVRRDLGLPADEEIDTKYNKLRRIADLELSKALKSEDPAAKKIAKEEYDQTVNVTLVLERKLDIIEQTNSEAEKELDHINTMLGLHSQYISVLNDLTNNRLKSLELASDLNKLEADRLSTVRELGEYRATSIAQAQSQNASVDEINKRYDEQLTLVNRIAEVEKEVVQLLYTWEKELELANLTAELISNEVEDGIASGLKDVYKYTEDIARLAEAKLLANFTETKQNILRIEAALKTSIDPLERTTLLMERQVEYSNLLKSNYSNMLEYVKQQESLATSGKDSSAKGFATAVEVELRDSLQNPSLGVAFGKGIASGIDQAVDAAMSGDGNAGKKLADAFKQELENYFAAQLKDDLRKAFADIFGLDIRSQEEKARELAIKRTEEQTAAIGKAVEAQEYFISKLAEVSKTSEETSQNLIQSNDKLIAAIDKLSDVITNWNPGSGSSGGSGSAQTIGQAFNFFSEAFMNRNAGSFGQTNSSFGSTGMNFSFDSSSLWNGVGNDSPIFKDLVYTGKDTATNTSGMLDKLGEIGSTLRTGFGFLGNILSAGTGVSSGLSGMQSSYKQGDVIGTLVNSYKMVSSLGTIGAGLTGAVAALGGVTGSLSGLAAGLGAGLQLGAAGIGSGLSAIGAGITGGGVVGAGLSLGAAIPVVGWALTAITAISSLLGGSKKPRAKTGFRATKEGETANSVFGVSMWGDGKDGVKDSLVRDAVVAPTLKYQTELQDRYKFNQTETDAIAQYLIENGKVSSKVTKEKHIKKLIAANMRKSAEAVMSISGIRQAEWATVINDLPKEIKLDPEKLQEPLRAILDTFDMWERSTAKLENIGIGESLREIILEDISSLVKTKKEAEDIAFRSVGGTDGDAIGISFIKEVVQATETGLEVATGRSENLLQILKDNLPEVGDTFSEAINAFTGVFTSTSALANALGQSYQEAYDLTSNATNVASRAKLVSAAGGLQEFTEEVNFYIQNIASSANKSIAAFSSVRSIEIPELPQDKLAEALGISEDSIAIMLRSKSGYEQMMMQLNNTNDSTGELRAQLLEASPAFATMIDTAAQAFEAVTGFSKSTLASLIAEYSRDPSEFIGKQGSSVGRAVAQQILGGLFDTMVAAPIADLVYDNIIGPIMNGVTDVDSIMTNFDTESFSSITDRYTELVSDPRFIEVIGESIEYTNMAAEASRKANIAVFGDFNTSLTKLGKRVNGTADDLDELSSVDISNIVDQFETVIYTLDNLDPSSISSMFESYVIDPEKFLENAGFDTLGDYFSAEIQKSLIKGMVFDPIASVASSAVSNAMSTVMGSIVSSTAIAGATAGANIATPVAAGGATGGAQAGANISATVGAVFSEASIQIGSMIEGMRAVFNDPAFKEFMGTDLPAFINSIDLSAFSSTFGDSSISDGGSSTQGEQTKELKNISEYLEQLVGINNDILALYDITSQTDVQAAYDIRKDMADTVKEMLQDFADKSIDLTSLRNSEYYTQAQATTSVVPDTSTTGRRSRAASQFYTDGVNSVMQEAFRLMTLDMAQTAERAVKANLTELHMNLVTRFRSEILGDQLAEIERERVDKTQKALAEIYYQYGSQINDLVTGGQALTFDWFRNNFQSVTDLVANADFTVLTQAQAEAIAALADAQYEYASAEKELLELRLDQLGEQEAVMESIRGTTKDLDQRVGEIYKSMGDGGAFLQEVYRKDLESARRNLEIAQQFGTTGEIVTAAEDVMRSMEDFYSSQEEIFEGLYSFSIDVADYLDQLKLSENSTLTNEQKLAEATNQFSGLLAVLQDSQSTATELENARSDIFGAADTLLELGRQGYASGQGFTDIYDFVTSSLSALGLEAGASAEELRAQAEAQRNEFLQSQLTELEAIRTILEAQQASTQTNIDSLATALSSTYSTISGLGLGAGVEQQLIDSISPILRAVILGGSGNIFTNSFLNNLPSYDVGSSYIPEDMIAKIHQGERILTAEDNKAVVDSLRNPSGDMGELVDEIRVLRAELKAELVKLREGNDSNTNKLGTVIVRSSEASANKIAGATTSSNDKLVQTVEQGSKATKII
jgi:hypothetical protein